jgi:4-aminobutyrate aminotransferase-like enzyme
MVSNFWGHPLSIAAARAVLRILERDGIIERAAQSGERLGTGLRELASSHPCVERVSGEGLLWGVVLRGDSPDHQVSVWRGDGDASTVGSRVSTAARERGVLIGTYDAQSLFIAPPLIIEEAEIDQILASLDYALGVVDEGV